MTESAPPPARPGNLGADFQVSPAAAAAASGQTAPTEPVVLSGPLPAQASGVPTPTLSDPESQPLAVEVPAAAGAMSVSGEPASILLVDDQTENLLALEAVLEPLGQRLVRARSGEEALRRMLREEFAVVLLDIRMPGLDGFETARFITARARTRHTPIIFLTGHDADNVEQAIRGYAVGAVDYVIKPFEPEVLRSKVRVFIELRQERARRVHEAQARAEAEATAAAVAKLQRVSDAALAHLELGELLPELVERVASLFGADVTGLLLAGDSSETMSLAASHGPEGAPAKLEVAVGEGFLGRLAHLRRPDVLTPAHDRADDLPPELVAARLHSLIGAPLSAGGRLLGVLFTGARTAGRFSFEDAALLGLCAERAAIAIDHAHAYERERSLVEELQRSLLPERLPAMPELAMSASYHPAEAATQVGGDWYDAIELPGGRMGLVIGDVVGHGVRAAAVMGELRSSLRAFAVEGKSPGVTLDRLEALVQTTHGEGMLATLAFVVVDPDARQATFASAGHPPPLLRIADEKVFYASHEVAPPLGVGQGRGFPECVLDLDDDSTLVLYTDGLVERRGEPLDRGLERLRDAVAEGPEDLDALCSHVLARMQAGHGWHDDVALLAARLARARTEGWSLRLPAEPSSVPVARNHLRRWLEGLGASRDEQFALQLAVSEASANAVEHAYGPGDHEFAVSADLRGEEVVLEVRDGGRWRPPRGRDRGNGLHLVGELTDGLEIDRGEHGTTVRVRQILDVGRTGPRDRA